MSSIMKQSTLFVASMLLLAGAGSARADTLAEARVPFPFVARGKNMPAGQYRIERDDADPSILILRGEKGAHASAMLPTMTASGHDPAGNQAALVFTREGSTYRLKDVWTDKTDGQEVIILR